MKKYNAKEFFSTHKLSTLMFYGDVGDIENPDNVLTSYSTYGGFTENKGQFVENVLYVVTSLELEPEPLGISFLIIKDGYVCIEQYNTEIHNFVTSNYGNYDDMFEFFTIAIL